MLQAVSLAFGLSILWLMLSGYWENSLLIGLGAASVFVCLLAAFRMNVLDREGHPVHMLLRAMTYWPWLFKEIVVANVDVARAILGIGGARPDPATFLIKATQKTDLGRVSYANSITLTPGTVAMVLDGDRILIHALTKGAADGLATGEMDRRVVEFEGEN